MGGLIDITGETFGKLTVVRHWKSEHCRTYWLCKCSCGKEKVVNGSNLKAGRVKSCGCLYNRGSSTHGMRKTRFYRIWSSMLYRSRNTKDNIMPYYKNIKCCKRWETFENFFKDMYKSYKEHISAYKESNTTIERINNEGDYTPENCRWATYKEQAANRR